MKKKLFYFTFMLLCLFVFNIKAYAQKQYELIDLDRIGVYNNNPTLTYKFETFYQFKPTSNYTFPNVSAKYNIDKGRPYSVSGLLYVDNQNDLNSYPLSNLTLTVNGIACKVDFDTYAFSTPDENGNDEYLRPRDNFYYFECNNVVNADNRHISFSIYGDYPDILSKVYLYANFVVVFEDTYNVQSGIADFKSIVNSKFNELIKQEEENSKKQLEATKENTDAINNVNDSINNSEVDTSNAEGFFSNFSDTDHGGIRGVINAPLKFLKHMTDTCKPLEFEIYDTKITLPCGDTLFWNKAEVQEFRATWNCIFGGAILYSLVLKLFKVIEGLKNPDDSRIEVMKL